MKINPRVIIVREAISKIVEMLAMKKIRVTQEGVHAYVEHDPRTNEPKRVNIPYLPDDATDELIDATQGFLDHEVAHVIFSDFKVLTESVKRGQSFKTLVNILEDTYIERKMAERFQGSGANLSATRRFVIEEIVEPEIRKLGPSAPEDKMIGILAVAAFRAWAGQAVYRDFMAPYWGRIPEFVKRMGSDAESLVQGIDSTMDSFKVAEEVVRRAFPPKPKTPGGEEKEPGEGEGEEESDEEGEEKSTKGSKSKKSTSSKGKSSKGKDEDEGKSGKGKKPAGAGEEKEEKEKEAAGEEKEEGEGGGKEGSEAEGSTEEEGEESGEGGKEEATEEEEGGGGEESEERELRVEDDSDPEIEIAEKREGRAEGDVGEANSGIWSAEDDRDPRPDKISEAITGLTEDFDDQASKAISRSALDLSKDADYLIWSTDYDKVEPIRVDTDFSQDPSRQAAYKRMIDKVDHMIGPLQKDIERAVAARSAAVWTSGHRSGRLHGASLARLHLERDDVFRRKQENRTKDVAVELVVDGSGSMSGKIETATYAAYALSGVLDRLMIPNEVIAFTTLPLPESAASRLKKDLGALKAAGSTRSQYSRHEALYIPVIKEFHERLNPKVKERFTTLANFFDGLNNNVDGECVQLAHRRLMRHRSTRKVMIVLSDGYPACYGNFQEVNVHLKTVVKQIQKSGTDIVGIGIQSAAVKDFYPKHVVLDRIEDLPGEVMRKLKGLLMPRV